MIAVAGDEGGLAVGREGYRTWTGFRIAAIDVALNSAMTFGGETPRLMTVTVSSTGFAGTPTTPLTRTTLPSFEDTAICAAALSENNGRVAIAPAATSDSISEIRYFIVIPP